VNHPHPRREFGLVPPEVAGRTSGFEFLQGLLDASHSAPPFSEVAEVWPISAEVDRVVFEAAPSARVYHPMGLVDGGWLALLLDTAMGCAVHSTLEPGRIYTTVEMKTASSGRSARPRASCAAKGCFCTLAVASPARKARSSTAEVALSRTAPRPV
jgi:hypothetical protein